MISTSFTLDELKQLENMEWHPSGLRKYPDLQIADCIIYDPQTIFYRTGDHMFKWCLPIKQYTEIYDYLDKIADHRRLVQSD